MSIGSETLSKILAGHAEWLRGDGWKRADIRMALLSDANLEGIRLNPRS